MTFREAMLHKEGFAEAFTFTMAYLVVILMMVAFKFSDWLTKRKENRRPR